MALQPHPRARPRPLHAGRRHLDGRARRARPGRRSCRGDDAAGRLRRPARAGRRPRAGSTTPWRSTRSWSTCPAGVAVRRPDRRAPHRARPTASRRPPTLVVLARRGAAPPRSWSSSRRRRRPAAPGHRDRRSRRAAQAGYVSLQQLDRGRLVHRRPRHRGAARRPTSSPALAGFGGDYARLRTDCRLTGRGASGHAAGRLLRRRRPDARLPHLPGPRRARHHQQPALQGHGRRPLAVRVHRPHPGGQGRPRHQRLPDEPQHQALRGRLGGVGPEPPDREQRRPLQPRVGGRARSTRSSASTSRAAACPPASPSG